MQLFSFGTWYLSLCHLYCLNPLVFFIFLLFSGYFLSSSVLLYRSSLLPNPLYFCLCCGFYISSFGCFPNLLCALFIFSCFLFFVCFCFLNIFSSLIGNDHFATWVATCYIGLTGLISLLSKGLSRVFSSTTIEKHQLFSAQQFLYSNSHICTWLLETVLPLTIWILGQSDVFAF